MKLHLPKALLTAALCAVSATTALAADIDVGTHTGGNNLASDEKNYYTISDLTLGEGDRMGVFKDGELVINGGFGKEQYEYGKTGSGLFDYGYKATSNGTVSKNVQVSGTLTLTGNAQVSLGGQYKTALNSGISSADEFTGLIANNLIVNDTATLDTWSAITNKVTVNGGTVNFHTYRAEGNLGYRLEGARDSKQVQFKEELNINGGTVKVGHVSYINHTDPDKPTLHNPETEYHTITTFGSFSYTGNPTIVGSSILGVSSYSIHSSLITQTAGTLEVAGKSLSIGGLNINQTGGTMTISKGTYHFISDYGDSTITQSGGTMTIGCLKAYNTYYDSIVTSLKDNGQTAEINPSVTITQSGNGTMHLNGVQFTNQKTGAASTELSSISQSGSGVINLNGEYKGVTFDVEQTGTGTINVNGALSTNEVTVSGGNLKVNADVTANDVKVSGGYLEVNADVTANSLTQSGTGKVTVVEGKTLTVGSLEITGGEFVNYGTISGSDAQAMFAASDIATAADSTATLITVSGGQFVNYGTTENSILVAGGTLTLEKGMLADVTMTDGNIVVNSNSTTGDLTLNGGTITFEEGVTLTLTEGATLNLSNTNIVVKVSEETLAGLLDGTNKTVTLFNTGGVTEGLENVTVTFTDGTISETAKVNGTTDGTGVEITTTTVPEPTTATLSLLALAALAARRRRR